MFLFVFFLLLYYLLVYWDGLLIEIHSDKILPLNTQSFSDLVDLVIVVVDQTYLYDFVFWLVDFFDGVQVFVEGSSFFRFGLNMKLVIFEEIIQNLLILAFQYLPSVPFNQSFSGLADLWDEFIF